jgi:hypothetical protein
MSRKNRELKFNPKLAREQKFKENGKFRRGGPGAGRGGKGFGGHSRGGSGQDFGGKGRNGGFGGSSGSGKNRPGKMKRTNMRNKKFSKKGGK